MIRITDAVKPPLLSESDSSDDESKLPTNKNSVAAISTISLQQEHDANGKASFVECIQPQNLEDDSEEIARNAFMELAKQKSQIDELKEQINKYTATKRTEKELNVQELLALGEGLNAPAKKYNKSRNTKNQGELDTAGWENVQENNAIPPQGLQIDVEPSGSMFRKEIGLDLEKIMIREVNKLKKECQVYMHKVHVLCWIAHGNLVSRVLNDQKVLATALSLVSSKFYPDGVDVDVKYLKEITAWYRNKFTLKLDTNDNKLQEQTLKHNILGQMESEVVTDRKLFVFIFVAMLRALGLQCRVSFNFVTVPLQPPRSQLWGLSTKSKKQSDGRKSKDNSNHEKPTNHSQIPSNDSENQVKILHTDDDKNILKIYDVDNNDDDDMQPTQSRRNRQRKAKTVISYTKVNDEEPIAKETENLQITKICKLTSISPRKTRSTNKNLFTQNNRLPPGKPKQFNCDLLEEDSDDEFKTRGKSDSDDEFKPLSKCLRPKLATKEVDRPVKSVQSDSGTTKVDVWCEVFIEDVEEWVPVDVVRGTVHCATKIHAGGTRPVRYVVGWDNDNYLKDVTKRYVPHWSTVTSSQRADLSWWAEATRPWVRPCNVSDMADARDKRENEFLNKVQLDAPLPKTFAGYKNHPLYALKRHLLKFEALSPNAAPLGSVRGEAVYPRACVHTCHSRFTWFKDAKVVKANELPCKIVQSRPKWSSKSGASYPQECGGECRSRGSKRYAEVARSVEPYKSRPYWHRFQRRKQATPKPLELFGPWQVEAYAPRAAVGTGGAVPRNARGYVDLFRPSMLPVAKSKNYYKESDYLMTHTLPGAEQTARRLRIDCAPALVGFAHARGRSRALCHGVVVCERHADTLVRACTEEQEEQKRKDLVDKEARVISNWRRLVAGLLARQRFNGLLAAYSH